MPYTKYAPLGERTGPGTFDCAWETDDYTTWEEAYENRDIVILDFVKDQDGVIYFEIYHINHPQDKLYYYLTIQKFIPRIGIDSRDDQLAIGMANGLVDKYKKNNYEKT